MGVRGGRKLEHSEQVSRKGSKGSRKLRHSEQAPRHASQSEANSPAPVSRKGSKGSRKLKHSEQAPRYASQSEANSPAPVSRKGSKGSRKLKHSEQAPRYASQSEANSAAPLGLDPDADEESTTVSRRASQGNVKAARNSTDSDETLQLPMQGAVGFGEEGERRTRHDTASLHLPRQEARGV